MAVEPADGDVAETARQLLDEAHENKNAGGDHFKRGQFEEALQAYGDALQCLDASGFCGQDPLRCALCSNQALCLLKLKRFAEAEERSSAALVADPASGKASFRRGVARLALDDAVGAYEDLQRASRLEPQDLEVRSRLDEARRMLNASGGDGATEEAVLACGAASALGGANGGLYLEKPDLNEGRLAETFKEQREWIKTITSWAEISNISFADEETKISVYMSLPGVQDIAPNKICVWMQATSLEVRVIDLNGENWAYVAQELYGQIDPAASSWKVRRDKISIKLQKRASARTWDKWEKLRRI
eukprot:TRINITY_DN56366_c0_g1_i1.p1 TRINITY_DN56366_c0_g1~~TRINITY_DN56366_c0_g1_i1.p1  ORF type:complete len:304 (-),score=74.43 TRINITY_DN56366_c0_g1_i1:263-1174(-)